MKRSIRLVVLAVVVSVTALVWIIAVRQSQRSDVIWSRLSLRFPSSTQSIRQTIANLKKESAQESLANLSDVNMFYSPGPEEPAMGVPETGQWLPLSANEGQSDVDAILSNRRVRKLYDHLAGMNKTAAATLVSDELSRALDAYRPLFDREVATWLVDQQGNREMFSVPAFVIHTPEPGKSKEVIAGARLRVLALVWIAGMLELTGAHEQVEAVARLALRQRDDMYAHETADAFVRAQLLGKASLYNRQIIGAGWIGTLPDASANKRGSTSVDANWMERKWAAHDAILTEFDEPVRVGAMQPDWKGSLTIRYPAPLSDRQFDALLGELPLTR